VKFSQQTAQAEIMSSPILFANRGIVLCFLLCLFSIPAYADFSGSVVSVLDGDTLEVLHNQHPSRIRLSGIDCPENGQAYGKKAKLALSGLVFGKEVSLQTHGLDKYKRTLAHVLLSDGTNVNHELVKDGWCWWYRKYAPLDAELEKLEKDARDAKKGLWGDPAPIPPWVYRKARRGQSFDLSDLVPLDAKTEGAALSRGSPLLGAPEPVSAASPYAVIGSRKSHMYHRPDCPHYSQVAPRNRVAFNSTAEAEKMGYRVAGDCP
jgi:micrococcal nuclease